MTGSAVKVSRTDARSPATMPAITAPTITAGGRAGSKRFHMTGYRADAGRRLVAGDAEEVAPVVEQLVEVHAGAGHVRREEAGVERDGVEHAQGEGHRQPGPGGQVGGGGAGRSADRRHRQPPPSSWAERVPPAP